MITKPDGSIVYQEAKVYDHKDHDKTLRKYKTDEPYVDLDCSYVPILLHGNVKFQFFDHDAYGSDEKVRTRR